MKNSLSEAQSVESLFIDELGALIGNNTELLGKELFFFETLDSTNNKAVELAEEGVREGAVILADRQTSGKGRRGRVWHSPAGSNLYMSIVLRPPFSPRDAGLLTLMAAAAAAFALRKTAHAEVSIKWPNDLVLSQKKLGGILTELKASGHAIRYAVIGIGINLRINGADLPDELRGSAVSLFDEGIEGFSTAEAAAAVIIEMDRLYRKHLMYGAEPVINMWKELSSTLGKAVRIKLENETISGTAEDIDLSGALLLRLPDNSVTAVTSGEVVNLR